MAARSLCTPGSDMGAKVAPCRGTCGRGSLLAGSAEVAEDPGSHDLGRRRVGTLDRLDDEAGLLDEPVDRPRQVAAVESLLLDGLEEALPALHVRLGGEAVLEEVQGAAGTQHASDLAECPVDVGDRAQGERREDGVGALVRETEPLAVEVAADDGDGAACAAVGAELPGDIGGLDRDDAGDLRRVEADVVPAAEAELDDLAAQALAGASAEVTELLVLAAERDEPRRDLGGPDSHRSAGVVHAGVPKRTALRSRARWRSTSRSLGGAVVVRWSSRCCVACATASTASSNAAWLAWLGLVLPLTLRTYCSAAARTSSEVAAGSKLWSCRMLRHMSRLYVATSTDGAYADGAVPRSCAVSSGVERGAVRGWADGGPRPAHSRGGRPSRGRGRRRRPRCCASCRARDR